MKSIHVKRAKPKPSIVYETYWRFATNRQNIFFQRQIGSDPPWTDDPILRDYKFTNAYRAADRTSQYLINQVIYNGESDIQEMFFRIILFKLFNKIETWERLMASVGSIRFRTYNFDRYASALDHLMENKVAIYSGAYIMASGRKYFNSARKHRNHLMLIEKMMSDELPQKIQDLFSMQEVFNLLLSYPTIGPFLSYQFSTDINYSTLTSFSEMEFVKAGPGALDGIRKCFTDLGNYSPEDAIRMVADSQEEEFDRYGLKFQDLWGRPLQLIDCQNLFCEVDKYARVMFPKIAGISGRKRIKQKYTPNLRGKIDYGFPPKWGITPQN